MSNANEIFSLNESVYSTLNSNEEKINDSGSEVDHDNVARIP